MTSPLDRRRLLTLLGAAGAMTALPAAGRSPAPLFRRAGKPLGVQLYTMGDLARTDLRGTLQRLAAIGYTDFQLPGFYGRKPADLRADADAAGVRFGSIHLALPAMTPPGAISLMSSPQEIADVLGVLGVTNAVLPFPPLPAGFSTPRGVDPRAALSDAVAAGGADLWKRLADLLNTRAAALKPFGIALGYHNHNMEFRPIGGTTGGTTGWAVLLGALDPALVFLEFDLGWAAAAGHDPAAELRRLKGRVKIVHLKDIKASTPLNYALAQDPAEVGGGRLDWRAILPACRAAGVEHYYVEQEPPYVGDRFASMQLSHDFLMRLTG